MRQTDKFKKGEQPGKSGARQSRKSKKWNDPKEVNSLQLERFEEWEAAGQSMDIDNMSPANIVTELDRYIIGQEGAKRGLAIAVRNRVRRHRVRKEMREEIYPHNIIMIGPTGCGKTEIARRLSRLCRAPFLKIEATKYTEVGYVGRDVESMVRDLANISVNLVRKEFQERVTEQATANAREQLLDLLLPSSRRPAEKTETTTAEAAVSAVSTVGQQVKAGIERDSAAEELKRGGRARELLARKLDAGELEDREVDIKVQNTALPAMQIMAGGVNMEDMDLQIQNMLGDILPKQQKRRRVNVKHARRILFDREVDRLVDTDSVREEAIRRAENMGIIFIDELDKVCGRSHSGSGPDISREGVQRDLLPIVEGATVQTRHGLVKTDHILFIAAGAFHTSRPEDLIPELQGRFPVRVKLEKLTQEQFRRILTDPKNSLVLQYQELLATDGVTLKFTNGGLDEIAACAYRVNEESENIGARRLYTIMEHLLGDISFRAPDLSSQEGRVTIDRQYVSGHLKDIVEDRDLSRYIL